MDKENMTQDMARVRYLVGNAVQTSDNLVNLAFRDQMSIKKLRRYLETAMIQFERSTLELRQSCERYAETSGIPGKKPPIPAREVTGSVEITGYDWLHIRVNTLIPSSQFRSADWFSDTIRRLLDEYEQSGQKLPYYSQALLVIEERSELSGRRAFDQDNKGWKAVSNAVKGRLIPDDDQYSLGVALLSTWSNENACHIYLLDISDAGDFFTSRANPDDS